jgi:hypothetical protein
MSIGECAAEPGTKKIAALQSLMESNGVGPGGFVAEVRGDLWSADNTIVPRVASDGNELSQTNGNAHSQTNGLFVFMDMNLSTVFTIVCMGYKHCIFHGSVVSFGNDKTV